MRRRVIVVLELEWFRKPRTVPIDGGPAWNDYSLLGYFCTLNEFCNIPG
jgi:hypothetical protein